MIVSSPVFSNNWVFLGEMNKYTSVSEKRFENIEEGEGVKVGVNG